MDAEDWVRVAGDCGVENLVGNLRTRLDCLEHWPLTVNDGEYDNAYTASFYNTYITYLQKELAPLGVWRRPLQGVLSLLGGVFRLCRVNRIVQMNNWLLSTNPVPPQFPEGWRQVLQRYPHHALVFRSLNEGFHQPLLDRFVREGWQLLPSRLIYRFDGERADFLRKDDVRRDCKLLADGRFHWLEQEDFDEQHWRDVSALYLELYRGKYPLENPAFTPRFFRLCARHLGWRILLLRDDQGQSVGVTGWWRRHREMIGTVVGYPLQLPQAWGLYRRLMTRVLLEAAEQKCWLNMSSGAGAFKRSRGGLPTLEFMACHHRHLPAWRRLPFLLLGHLLGPASLQLLRRYA